MYICQIKSENVYATSIQLNIIEKVIFDAVTFFTCNSLLMYFPDDKKNIVLMNFREVIFDKKESFKIEK